MAKTLFSLLALTVSLAVGWTVTIQSSGFWGTQSLSSTVSGSESVSQAETFDEYRDSIQPLFNARCIQCHSCYNAPCQLNLTSYEGLMRGATKTIMYQPQRTRATVPTRLGQDAHSTHDWRQRGFFPVTQDSTSQVPSLIERLVRLKDEGLDPVQAADSHSCPVPQEVDALLKARPHYRMPYNLPGLTQEEMDRVTNWLRKGAPGPEVSYAPAEVQLAPVKREVEAFLNRTSLEERLVSRYLYEHLFLAHLQIEPGSRQFYRLIRSRSTCNLDGGSEISTRRPTDDPGGDFFYCLKPYRQTPVEKTLLLYRLDRSKLAWLDRNFFSTDWKVFGLPTYGSKEASNPFRTFAAIPVEARYRYLLEDSRYHVATFIKGPVCNGMRAVNSIDEQFFVYFLKPESDLFVKDPEFRQKSQDLLVLPAEQGIEPSLRNLINFISVYPEKRNAYRRERQAAIERNFPEGLSLQDIWDGDNKNPNALLTVFRHSDHSYVAHGAIGAPAPSAFVLDYALFERLVYNLVVGFDVFGNITHQTHTRVYMGMIRLEGENNFLDLFPPELRQPIRDSWYSSKFFGRLEKSIVDRPIPDRHRSQIAVPRTTNLKEAREWMYKTILEERLSHMRPLASRFQADSSWFEPLISKELGQGAPFIKAFPDTVLIGVTDQGRPTSMWTLARNKASVSRGSMIDENFFRNEKSDTLILLPGIQTSYPNQMFMVEKSELAEFIAEIQKLRRWEDFRPVIKKWGLDQQDPQFWSKYERVQAVIDQTLGIEKGVIDLTRLNVYLP